MTASFMISPVVKRLGLVALSVHVVMAVLLMGGCGGGGSEECQTKAALSLQCDGTEYVCEICPDQEWTSTDKPGFVFRMGKEDWTCGECGTPVKTLADCTAAEAGYKESEHNEESYKLSADLANVADGPVGCYLQYSGSSYPILFHFGSSESHCAKGFIPICVAEATETTAAPR
jgi:hypothetical protein